MVGRLMAEADMQGSDGHGVIRLPPYAREGIALPEALLAQLDKVAHDLGVATLRNT